MLKKNINFIENFTDFKLMKEQPQDWASFFSKSNLQKTDCVPDLLKYRVECLKKFEAKNISLIRYINNHPVAIIPMILSKNKVYAINNTTPNLIAPSIDTEIKKKKRLAIYEDYLSFVMELKKKYKIKKIRFDIDSLYFQDIEFMNFLIEKKFNIENSKCVMLVKKDMITKKFKKDFRKSYKYLIKAQKFLFTISALHSENFEEKIWSSYKKMHIRNSNRARSDETYKIQKNAILNKNAVLIYLKNKKKFLGFNLFFFSNHEAIFASAAYDEISKKKKIPIGHLLQDSAISFFEEEKITYYKIGSYEHKRNKETARQKNVIFFKMGFANSYSTQFILSN